MTKVKMDWSKTIIYKIVCNDLNIKDCYVGSTTSFSKRKCMHKSDCNNPNSNRFNLNVYRHIRCNGGWENWSMIEIERYNAIDNNDAHKKERYWIEHLGATLNKQIPSRTVTEYYSNNKDKISKYKKEYNRQYHQDNSERINKKCTCLCGGKYTNINKTSHYKTTKHTNFEADYEDYILNKNPTLEQLIEFINRQ
jgi:hypothetical protein